METTPQELKPPLRLTVENDIDTTYQSYSNKTCQTSAIAFPLVCMSRLYLWYYEKF